MDASSDDPDAATGPVVRLAVLASLLLFSCTKVQNRTAITAPHPPPGGGVTKAAVPAPPKKIKKKKLYLTFDDGPNKGTKNVLDIVQDEGVPATFFLVAEHAFASAYQQAVWDSLKAAEGIDLCNHSFSHAHGRYDRYYQNPDSVVADFTRAADSLGLTNNIARTPGRNIWRLDTLRYTDIKKSSAAADSLKAAGYTLMGWDLEWHYEPKTLTVKQTAEQLLAQIDSVFARKGTKVPDHLVILAHDQVYGKSADSFQLRQFMQQLKKKGDYELAVATTYPGIAPTQNRKDSIAAEIK